ncbi:hypothetical protein TNCV_1706281, partial [Trichonephila clavipes]
EVKVGQNGALGLWDCSCLRMWSSRRYNKCFFACSDEMKEKTIALYAEYFPGEYTLDEGIDPYFKNYVKGQTMTQCLKSSATWKLKGDNTREKFKPIRSKQRRQCKCITERKFCICEKMVVIAWCKVYMVNVFKLPNQAPRGSDESLHKYHGVVLMEHNTSSVGQFWPFLVDP